MQFKVRKLRISYHTHGFGNHKNKIYSNQIIEKQRNKKEDNAFCFFVEWKVIDLGNVHLRYLIIKARKYFIGTL